MIPRPGQLRKARRPLSGPRTRELDRRVGDVALCQQQAADMLAPHAMAIMSLQVILRMRRDMGGEELDRAAASVLSSFQLRAERARRARWLSRMQPDLARLSNCLGFAD